MRGDGRTTVHLVRHGEVENPGQVLYGRMAGFNLSPSGVQMASLMASYLGDRDLALLVTSPLERARQTMEPLADAVHLPVTVDKRVIEAVNDLEGLNVGSSPRQLLLHPRSWPKLINPVKPSWGEPYTQIAMRMRAAIDDARKAATGHEAVIVSHQGPIWVARLDAEGRRLWHLPTRRECALASVTSLTFLGAHLTAVTYAEPAAGSSSKRGRN